MGGRRLSRWKEYRPGGQAGGRRQVLRVLLTGTAALAAAACGVSRPQVETGGQAASSVPVTAAARATASAGPQRRGGDLRLRLAGSPTLDPVTSATAATWTLAGYLYSRLLQFESGSDPNLANNLELRTDLAAGYEVLDGGLTYVVRLRPARFHNVPPVNGRDITAEDVAASVVRFRDEPKNANRTVLQPPQAVIDKIEIPDTQTVVFRLSRRYASFLTLLANSAYLYIFPKEAGRTFEPLRQAIGSGPFVLESMQPDVSIRLRRNPDYHATGQPLVETAELVLLREDALELAQLQAGRLDVSAAIPGLSGEQVNELRRSGPAMQAFAFVDGVMDYLAPQQRGVSPFRDERVRRALALAVNRDELLRSRYEGTGWWHAAVPVWHSKTWLDPKSAGAAAQWATHNPAEARRLLQAAGADGLKLRFNYTSNGFGDRYNQAAETIAQMLRDAGFAPTLTSWDFTKEWLGAAGVATGGYEGVAYALHPRYSDPHEYLFNALQSKSARNLAGIADPQLDLLLEDEAQELDTAKRTSKFKDIQRYVMERAYYAYGAVGNAYAVAQPWVRNYTRNAAYGQGSEMAANLWLDKG